MATRSIFSYTLLVTTTVLVGSLSYGLVSELATWLSDSLSSTLRMFFIALSSSLALYAVWLRRSSILSFWMAFDHELAHLLAAVVSLHKVRSFSVSDAGRGGVVTDRRTFMIEQAPYVATVPMIVLLVIVLASDPAPTWWLAIILGTSLAYHFTSVVQAFWYDRADMIGFRVVFHAAWTVAAMVLWAGIAIAAADKGGSGVDEFMIDSWDRTLSLVQ